MIRILNLTQHATTKEQLAEGVIEPSAEDKQFISELLTFEFFPISEYHMNEQVEKLAQIVVNYGCNAAMIEGAPFFMRPLETGLMRKSIFPMYAFSLRESVEQMLPDGSMNKTSVFRHVGLIAPFGYPNE